MKLRAGENLMRQLLLLVVLVPVEPLLVELDHHLPIGNSHGLTNYEGGSVADPEPSDPYVLGTHRLWIRIH